MKVVDIRLAIGDWFYAEVVCANVYRQRAPVKSELDSGPVHIPGGLSLSTTPRLPYDVMLAVRLEGAAQLEITKRFKLGLSAEDSFKEITRLRQCILNSTPYLCPVLRAEQGKFSEPG